MLRARLRLQAAQHGAACTLALRGGQDGDVDQVQHLILAVQDQAPDGRVAVLQHQVYGLRIRLPVTVALHALLHGDQLLDDGGICRHLAQVAARGAVQRGGKAIVVVALDAQLVGGGKRQVVHRCSGRWWQMRRRIFICYAANFSAYLQSFQGSRHAFCL
ncbi:hypothetical protein D3C72_1720820 [compost metagenome]